MKQKKKKSLIPSVIAMIICVLLFFFAIISVVIAVNDIEKGDMPYFLGVGICSSNGIYDGVEKNAVILAKKVSANSLVAGDVVVFNFANAQTNSKLYLGNIIEIGEDGSLVVYLGNGYENQEISMEDVRGKAVYSIANIGYLVSILEGRYGVLLSMASTVLLLAVIVLLIGNLFALRSENKAYAALSMARVKNQQMEQDLDLQEEPISGEEGKMMSSSDEPMLAEQPIVNADKITDNPIVTPEQQILETRSIESTEKQESSSISTNEALKQEIIKEEDGTQQEEIEKESIQPEHLQDESPVAQNVKSSYLKGSFGTDRVSIEVTCEEKEAEVMKKLIDLTAKKRNRFGLFTSITYVEEYVLKVWCEWEDVPIIASVITEVKKRTAKKD